LEDVVPLIHSLLLKGWRSFSPDNSSGLNDLAQVNIIAGANNVGKSNYLRFISWLRDQAYGRPPSEVSIHSANRWMRQSQMIEAEIGLSAAAIREAYPLAQYSHDHLGLFGEAVEADDGVIRLLVRFLLVSTSGKYRVSYNLVLRGDLRPTLPPWAYEEASGPVFFMNQPTSEEFGRTFAYDKAMSAYTEVTKDDPRKFFACGVARVFFQLLGDGAFTVDPYRRNSHRVGDPSPHPQSFRTVHVADAFRRTRGMELMSSDGTGVIQDFFGLDRIEEDNRYPALLGHLEQALRRWLHDDSLQVESKVVGRESQMIIRMGDLRLNLADLGSGISELVLQYLYLLLRTSDDARRDLPVLLLIDDPECHLHPSLLIDFVKTVAKTSPNCQLLMTSHSSALMDGMSEGWRLFHAEQDALGATQTSPILRKPSERRLMESLGVSPGHLALASVILWVEGPSDAIYLRRLLADACPNKTPLEHRDYAFAMYGGSVLSDVDFESGDDDALVQLLSICPRPIVICDRDEGFGEDGMPDDSRLKKRVRRLMASASGARSGDVKITLGREIENFVQPAVLWAALAPSPDGTTTVPPPSSLSVREPFVKWASRALSVQEETIHRRKRALACTVVSDKNKSVFTDDAIQWGKELVQAINRRS
jgi:hypothetical protein